MAEAVLKLFPDAKLGIGPWIENGFYYDFDLPRPLTPDDLATIEALMRAADRRGQPLRAAADQPRGGGASCSPTSPTSWS